jgi:60 kDa SS-A/Ro ribonucleoprotein
MKLNVADYSRQTTHEGGPAKRISPEQELRRSVLSCLLWEKQFYEDGQDIADRIESLCEKVDPSVIAALAVEARTAFHLRHVPLLLASCLAKRGGGRLVADTVEAVVQRADELAEILAVYWRNGRCPISNGLKKGLALAFTKFSPYQLAKYNRDGAIKLRDVLFLVHAKPKDADQAETWKKLVDGTLESPDTWEVSLSAGAGKRETFERLIREGKLGYLALLRNLRNMAEAGVDSSAVKNAILCRAGAGRVLPFRYVAAARACPQYETTLDIALLAAISELPALPGKTLVLVDISGSMDSALSGKSDLRRIDAAAALASIIPGDVRVFSFTDAVKEVPPRRGMAGVDAILSSQPHGGTYLGHAVKAMNAIEHDRLVVITDEQSADSVPDPLAKHAYMINVASHRNGVGYGRWTHLDGFSENVIRFIAESEAGR